MLLASFSFRKKNFVRNFVERLIDDYNWVLRFSSLIFIIQIYYFFLRIKNVTIFNPDIAELVP